MVLATAVALVAAGYYSWTKFGPSLTAGPVDRPLTSVVRRATFTVTVTERGNLESTRTVDGVCEVRSREIKIIELVPEGTQVKKGDVVVRFDSSEIDKEIEDQQIRLEQAQAKITTTEQEVEIVKNKAEEDVSTARIEHKLSKLTLKKYDESDFPSEIFEIQGNIAQQESKAEETTNKVDQIRELVRKGFRTPEQLRTAELELQQYDFALKANQQKLKGKKNYEFELKTMELSSKVMQAEGKVKRAEATSKASVAKALSEFESAKATHKMEQKRLDERMEMKSKTVIKAEQPGVVAYANEDFYDSSRQIREGAMVYFRQKIFTLPDMSSMQVKVNVHESLIKKVSAGQKAEIRIDAFPNILLRGTVKNVSAIADSTRSWMSGGAKEYSTLVTIDAMPDADLRPGMTTEVKILVNTIRDALVVPMQCVVAHKGHHYVYVQEPETISRREVEIGETNEKLVQIVKGLEEGDLVAQDAQFRADAEFKNESNEDDHEDERKLPKDQANPPSPGLAEPKEEAESAPEPSPKGGGRGGGRRRDG